MKAEADGSEKVREDPYDHDDAEESLISDALAVHRGAKGMNCD